MHTYKGTDNAMNLQTIGALAFGPPGNFQGSICCYSLLTCKILHHLFCEVTVLKMPENVKRYLRYIVRKEKAVKGLTFGDYNNNIDSASVITGVDSVDTNDKNNRNNNYHFNFPDKLKLGDTNRNNDTNIGGNNSNLEDGDAGNSNCTGVADIKGDNNSTEVTDNDNTDDFQQHRSNNKFIPPDDEDSKSDNKGNSGEKTVTTTRLGRVSKPYDYATHFLELYVDKNLGNADDTLCLRPYYPEKQLNLHLGASIIYSNNSFTDGVTVTNMSTLEYS